MPTLAPHHIAFGLLAIHPVSFTLLVMGFEPIPFAIATVCEGAVWTLAVVATLPPSGRRQAAPEPEWSHAGFEATWRAGPDVDRDEAAGVGFIAGLTAGAGALVWIPAGLMIEHADDPVIAMFLGGALAAASAVPTFVFGWMFRAIRNAFARNRWVEVTLEGRSLTVDGTTWIRDDSDQVTREDGAVVLRRDGRTLRIPGGPATLDWFAEQLEKSTPEVDGDAPDPAIDDLIEQAR